jgi:hypothetical protein
MKKGIQDDGIIDEIAVERLLSGHLHWTGATLAEREEACRRICGEPGWSRVASDVLNLRSNTIKKISQRVRGVAN